MTILSPRLRSFVFDCVYQITRGVLKPVQLALEIVADKKTTVGSSDRSPGKHDFLNAVLGREVGVFCLNRRNMYGDSPYVILDLCAGDGRPNIYSKTSSPMIISKHIGTLDRASRPYRVLLVEKAQSTFDNLRPFKQKGMDLLHSDNKSPAIAEWLGTHIQEDTPVFVHNDPNTVNDWGLSDELVETLSRTRYFTTFSTLGCNPGGLKRLDFESRKRWFAEMDKLCYAIPKHHDAVLFSLSADASQWAYLVTGPRVWMDYIDKGVAYNRYIGDFRRAFGYWKNGLRCARMRTNPDEFQSLVNFLFLTKEELDDVGN